MTEKLTNCCFNGMLCRTYVFSFFLSLCTCIMSRRLCSRVFSSYTISNVEGVHQMLGGLGNSDISNNGRNEKLAVFVAIRVQIMIHILYAFFFETIKKHIGGLRPSTAF